MSALFKKLNLKDQAELLVLDAPGSLEAELAALAGRRVLRATAGLSAIDFALAFVQTREAIESHARSLAGLARGDAILWFAYPKASSKKYRCDFNRDTGWEELGRLGYEPVRQVAIDEDWSAVRFRKAEFIKTMIRPAEAALSEAGRAKAGKQAEP